MIAGVCGGIAEYFDVDPVFVRLAAVLLVFLNGIGVLMYIIAWILIPENPKQKISAKTTAEDTVDKVMETTQIDKTIRAKSKKKDNSIILGLIIVFFGLSLLFKNFFDWFDARYIWPIGMIVMGMYLIMRKPR